MRIGDTTNKEQPVIEIPAELAQPVKVKKVAIVGFASHWHQAPFDDKDFEVWSLNEAYDMRMADGSDPWAKAKAEARLRWFEIHGRETEYAGNPFFHSRNASNEHAAKMAALGCPVYMQKHWDDIPTSIEYPLQAMIAKYGGYFTNSISYMLALALSEGFQEIHIYGVDMAQGTEYCVAPETRVLTADLQWIQASEVLVGQKLMAFEEYPRTQNDLEGRYRQWKSATVEEATRLVRPCYRLHMADGTTLVCSAEHRWLIHRCNEHRWMETSKLQPADVYPVHSSKIVKLVDVWEPDTSWAAGYLAAAFDGEGHLSQVAHQNCASSSFNIGFAQKPNGMSRAVECELQKRGFEFGSSVTDCVTKYCLKGGRPEKIRFLGQIRPKRLLEKFNPDEIGITQSMANVPVLKVEYIGEQTVIGLKTTTGTFVAEGFASHNSAQRPSCEYFLGIAKAVGVRVFMPEASDLLKTSHLYGWEQPKAHAMMVKLDSRKGELQTRLGQVQAELARLNNMQQQLLGALENQQYMREAWVAL